MKDNGWNRLWAGKAKRRAADMEYSTADLMALMISLKLIPKGHFDDWEEDFRCYVNRVLGKK